VKIWYNGGAAGSKLDRLRKLSMNPLPVLWLCLATVFFVVGGVAADDELTRVEDVIYGRKYGTALTLDLFVPKKPNGAAIVYAASGGWFSMKEFIDLNMIREYLHRGYTVCAVVHGSQPKYTIPEILDDMNRSIRFIRSRASQYQIDPHRIGICGASAGGHLSLMIGTAGTSGDPQAKDPIDRESSRVQAVACFFPPTDFLNYGKPGEVDLGTGVLKPFRAPFDFHELDKTANVFLPITDEKRRQEIGRAISPIYHVSADDPPSLIVHGIRDVLVPIQQAESIIAKFQAVSVPCELVKRDEGHGWTGFGKETTILADWFDKYLAKK
jgi:acetyl esterase/lipase